MKDKNCRKEQSENKEKAQETKYYALLGYTIFKGGSIIKFNKKHKKN